MKINEILKRENLGRSYKIADTVCEVGLDDSDCVCLLHKGNLVSLSSAYLEADFKEVKNGSGWVRNISIGNEYYCIMRGGTVEKERFGHCDYDFAMKISYNMFSSEEKAEEVAREQLLYRKMKKFRDENDEEVEWECYMQHKYYIAYDFYSEEYKIYSTLGIKHLHTVYFTTRELAERCLEKVVKPLMEVETDVV